MFVTDLDGTLLPTGKEVSEENIRAVREAVAQGVVVTIATGRMYKASLPIAKALGVDVPIITYNGALIKSVAGEVLYTSFLPEKYILEILEFCRTKKWYIQCYSDDELYYAERNFFSEGYEKAQKILGRDVGWEGMKEHTGQVAKLLLISETFEETQERIEILRREFGDEVSVMSSNPHYAEVTNPGVSKAAGIERLAEILGIDMAATMSIGDAENDLSMLKATGKSIAMGNAVPQVKEICDYVTGECEANGFAEAIRRYVLRSR